MSETATLKPGDFPLAMHFKTPEQQFNAAKLGMWVFLMTEVLMFSGLFVAYTIFSNLYPELYKECSKLLDWKMGTLNTAVLIFSSFTMAMAVQSAQRNKQKALLIYLAITFICAVIFLVVKYFEYTHKFHLGIFPGNFFVAPHIDHPMAPLFFGIYFTMTGLHGVHVIVGMGVLGYLFFRSLKGAYSDRYFTQVEIGGLYWHIVDLVWIYLFPLLYLV